MPRSFLVKKKVEKSWKASSSDNEASETVQGHEADCQKHTRTFAFTGLTQKPFHDSRVQHWKDLGTTYTYPAEVTSMSSFHTSEGEQSNVKPEAEDFDQQVDFGKARASGDRGMKHECPQCHKGYSTLSGLTKHLQFHCSNTHQRKSFTCKYCEKVYVSLGALKMHIRTHTLPCKCKICGKAFSRPWLLQGHIRTHTGEKPYQCPSCQRAFADRSNLRAHLQTHSEVKKYSCTRCSRSFSRMSLLLKHEDTVCLDISQN